MDRTLSSKVPKPYVHMVDEASMGVQQEDWVMWLCLQDGGGGISTCNDFYLWFGHLVFLFTVKYDLEKNL